MYNTAISISALSDTIGPTGSAEDVTGGLPIYHGFEQDVFQAISNYFTQQLSHPLIPQSLYELILTSIHPLIARKDSTATDALQLLSLMIEPSLRLKLHRLLRFISKAGNNEQLKLSLRISNRELVRIFVSFLIYAFHFLFSDA